MAWPSKKHGRLPLILRGASRGGIPEVKQFQNSSHVAAWVARGCTEAQQQVAGFDVTMHHSQTMYVRQGRRHMKAPEADQPGVEARAM